MVKGKYFNFILSGIRHSLSKIITIILLFIFASAMLNIFFFLTIDYTQNFYREKEKLNGADLDYLYTDISADPSLEDKLSKTLSKIEGAKQFEINKVFTCKGTVDFKDGYISDDFTFLNYDDAIEKKISQYEILESDDGSGVYLSYLFKVDGGYSIGQNVNIKIGNSEKSYRVAGFYNNINTGTKNCVDLTLLTTNDCPVDYDGDNTQSYRINVLLDESLNSDIMESEIANRINDEHPSMVINGSSSVVKLSSSRYVTATIFRAIICLSAVLMIAVVLTVETITLSNYIRNNKKTLGTLKAMGYTSRNLITPIVIEFSCIGLFSSLFGTALSYFLFPLLNSAMENQVGIPYSIHFLPVAALLSIGICIILAAASSYLSVAKIHSIAPINAIRESHTGKIKKHQFIPLDKTRLGLNTAIALKTWISAFSRNIVIFISMAGVAFLIGFACFSYQNVILNPQNIIDLVCGQMTDSTIVINNEIEDSFCEELKKSPEVDRFYMFSVSTIMPKDLPKMVSYIIDDRKDIDEDRICIKGKLPVSDSEIAVNGSYAANNSLEIGDTITFEINDESVEFDITGFIQGSFSAGRDCYITREGYSKISTLHNVGYFIDLKKGEDIDEFNKNIAEKCEVVYTENYRKGMETVSLSYKNILIIATAVLAVLSFIIAGFILYILISIFLSNKKREHGILKSLGFVTGDIIFQTVFSIFPTCAAATIIGLLISRNGVAKLLTTALNGVGIFSFGTPTEAIYLLIAGFFMLGFTVLYSILLSSSVRKITPHKLFTNE